MTPSVEEQEIEADLEPEVEAVQEIDPEYQQVEDDELAKLLPESSGTVANVKYEIDPEFTDLIEADEEDNDSLVEETQYECLMADDDGNIVKIENVSDQLIVPDPTEVYLYDSDDEVAVLDNVLDDEYEHENVVKKCNLPPKPKIKPEDPRRRGAGGVYICEQCGNHIKGRMAFELHCRRHRGEKDFQCE